MDITALVLILVNTLKVVDAHVIGEYLIALGLVEWAPGHSCFVQASKILTRLAHLGKIVKCRGYYRAKGCTSDYKPHAKKLTKLLLLILSYFPHSLVYREIDAPPGVRADSIVLIRKSSQEGGDAILIILECVITEDPQGSSITRKKNVWASWEGTLPFLSKLTGYEIPHYEFLTSEELQTFLEDLK